MAARTDELLVLRRHPYGESSLVIQALTRANGRVHLLAKGAFRPKSGYCGVLDLFDTLELTWAGGERGDLGLVRAAQIRTRRAEIPRDLARYRPALAVLELTELVTRPGAGDTSVFDLLEEALDRLVLPGRPSPRITAAFDLRLLSAVGLEPALLSCASCGGPAAPSPHDPDRAVFSAGSGGRLCLECAHSARATGKRVGTLPLAVLEGAEELLHTGELSPERAETIGDAVADFAQRFLEYHLEARPRTRDAPTPVPTPPG